MTTSGESNRDISGGSQVLITVDTELSPRLHADGASLQKNMQKSILATAGNENYGVGWQMDQMERCGIKGIFFVDPMPGLVFGRDCVARMIEPIIRRGHEIQVHIHTEWLQWARNSPVDGRQGHCIGDFTLSDQQALIGWARDSLVAAGAPRPSAFRAGNFGANDDTLRALARLGLHWDTSFNPAYASSLCRINLSTETVDPVTHRGVVELPVAGLWDWPGRFRPAQVCATSTREMRLALAHAVATRAPAFVVVTHSFEMLSRDRVRPNKTVIRRFKKLCDVIEKQPKLESVGFAQMDRNIAHFARPKPMRLPPNRLRTMTRVGEQALATWRFERRLRPG